VLVAAMVGISIGCLSMGFVAGWLGSRRLSILTGPEPYASPLKEKGDAPEGVRNAVTRVLREFQAGYSKRDLRQLGGFMERLFPNDEPILICGTNAGEWNLGRASAERLIGADWASWGDVRLAVDDAMISSSGDVAWLATTGTVTEPKVTRSIRFLAVLRRANDRWLFRQIQYQWDDNERPVRLLDLLRPSIIVKLHLR
jgi:hypothetical protein